MDLITEARKIKSWIIAADPSFEAKALQTSGAIERVFAVQFKHDKRINIPVNSCLPVIRSSNQVGSQTAYADGKSLYVINDEPIQDNKKRWTTYNVFIVNGVDFLENVLRQQETPIESSKDVNQIGSIGSSPVMTSTQFKQYIDGVKTDSAEINNIKSFISALDQPDLQHYNEKGQEKDDVNDTPTETETVVYTEPIDLNNLGKGTQDSKKLQELIYQVYQKLFEAKLLENTDIKYKNFVKYRGSSADTWDGDIGVSTKRAIKSLKQILGEKPIDSTIDTDFIGLLQKSAAEGFSVVESTIKLKTFLLQELNEQVLISKRDLDAYKKSASGGGGGSSGKKTKSKKKSKSANKTLQEFYNMLRTITYVKGLTRSGVVELSYNNQEAYMQNISYYITGKDVDTRIDYEFQWYFYGKPDADSIGSLADLKLTSKDNGVKINNYINVEKTAENIQKRIEYGKLSKNSTVIPVYSKTISFNEFMGKINSYRGMNPDNPDTVKYHIKKCNAWTRNIAWSIKDFIEEPEDGHFERYESDFWGDDEEKAWDNVVMQQYDHGHTDWHPYNDRGDENPEIKDWDVRAAHSWKKRITQLESFANQLKGNKLADAKQAYLWAVKQFREMFEGTEMFGLDVGNLNSKLKKKFLGNYTNDDYYFKYPKVDPDNPSEITYKELKIDTDFG